jgi:parallel beta-helix repeat protein
LRRIVSSLTITLLFLGLSALAFTVQPARAQSGTIYINPDGSITPSTANITTSDHVTYTFTGNNYLPIVVNRSNIIIIGRGNAVRGGIYSGDGFHLSRVSNVTIKNTTITDSFDGVYLTHSSRIVLSGNNITADGDNNILLDSSSNNTISGNNIENNNYGILIALSSNNRIIGNNITGNNAFGIDLQSASSNSIIGNNIANNHYGVGLYYSSNNTIYHNSFKNNAVQVYQYASPTSKDFWDDGYPSGGNYWSNYTGAELKNGVYQNQTGNDGIGDTPYVIDANNTDHYPLMGTFYNYSVYLSVPPYNVTVISNSTITGFTYGIWLENQEVFISFKVTGKQGSTGFCRVSIPKAMMKGTYHVSVNGTEIPYALLPCSNATVSYLYFNYTHSTEQVIIVPEFPSFLIPPLFMIITPLGAVAFKKRATKTRR